MLRARHLAIFLPALVIGAFGFFIQVVRYAPPKEQPAPQVLAHDLVPVYDDDPILGDKRAPKTIILFADLACEPCREQIALFRRIMKEYPKKIKVVAKGLPVTRFPISSEVAHHYAYCANEQQQFDAFDERVTESSNALREDTLQEIARALALDEHALLTCLSSGRPEAYQAKTEALATALDIQTVPTIFMNNERIDPPRSFEGWLTRLQL